MDEIWRRTRCGRSRDQDHATYEHVRLGMDEPPEMMMCRCKDANEIVQMIGDKLVEMNGYLDGVEIIRGTIDMHTGINPVMISFIDEVPKEEVEIRMDNYLSENLFVLMNGGMFGPVEAEV